MDTLGELPEAIRLTHEEEDWIQTIDYEHILFQCRKCHEHEHLLRERPLNVKTKQTSPTTKKGGEGFTEVMNRKRQQRI